MDLKKVDVFQVQPLQARVHRVKNVFSTKSVCVEISLSISLIYTQFHSILEDPILNVSHRGPQLRRNDDVFSAPVVFFDRFSEDDL